MVGTPTFLVASRESDVISISSTTKEFKEGARAYWDYECRYVDTQPANPYPVYSKWWRDWNEGWRHAYNQDDL